MMTPQVSFGGQTAGSDNCDGCDTNGCADK
jgi:hypothetical protein